MSRRLRPGNAGDARWVEGAVDAAVRIAPPRHCDLLTLWASTAGADARGRVADVVRERTAACEEPDVGLLWHAVAHEQLVLRLTQPDRGDGLDVAFARRLVDARRMAAELGSPVRGGG